MQPGMVGRGGGFEGGSYLFSVWTGDERKKTQVQAEKEVRVQLTTQRGYSASFFFFFFF